MEQKQTVTVSLLINAPREKVWEGLTSPELIKQYFFGTDAISDWKKGSPLLFKGEWEGKSYVDKGTILESDAPNLFSYNYYSSWSPLEDKPENYAVITYKLTEDKGITLLTITQEGIMTDEQKAHSEENWKTVMSGMKKLVE